MINRDTHPNINSQKPTAVASAFIRVFSAVLGILVGIVLYLCLTFGASYIAVPILSKDEYDVIELSSDVSTTGGDITSSWSDGGHTKLFYDPNHPIIKVDKKDPNVENILVFGIDSRGTEDFKCRTDAIMVVSINKSNNSIKLVSLMRDVGVYIGDTDDTSDSSIEKLNAAYANGGIGLMINTINRNFDLDIQRFVMFDFASASRVIDMCGGVDIDVSAAEVRYANHLIEDVNQLTGSSSPFLTKAGMQTLDGVQAVSWSRIRALDSDFVRTSRQREIAMALIRKVSNMNYFDRIKILEKTSVFYETNMQSMDIIRVGLNGVSAVNDITEYRLPADNLFTVQNDPWMIIVDYNLQKEALHQYIWGT